MCSESIPLQGAASLCGTKPRACRTPPNHSPTPKAEPFDKDYPGTAGFSLCPSPPIPLQVLADADSPCLAGMSPLSRGQRTAPAPHPHASPTKSPSGLCFPCFAECFVCLAVALMLQPSACSESPGEGANFNICLSSSFQTYTNWNNASLGICLLLQFANCGFRSALFSTH